MKNTPKTIATASQLAVVAAAIGALDLEPIKFKLVADREGPQWNRATADKAEADYRRFLVLCALYPNREIVPSTTIDKFWHAHILDTMKYAEDCQTGVGFFLHHFPYFGMRGEEDRAALESAFDETQTLWKHHFGEREEVGLADCKMQSSVNPIKLSLGFEAREKVGPADCKPMPIKLSLDSRPRLAAA